MKNFIRIALFYSSLAIEFYDDAIVLSGSTGTRLKSRIIGKYYPIWWNITSGGESNNHKFGTTIIELNAATGENYIEDTKETILGSSGHALSLKFAGIKKPNLLVLLVEQDPSCFTHLQNVIKNRWPEVKLNQLSSDLITSEGLVLLNRELKQALESIGDANLGNCIYFFDPLLYTPFSEISQVADYRVKSFYQTRTEFIIFVFTSDWFLGRKSIGLAPLPNTDESKWTLNERMAVYEADKLFGDKEWRRTLLTSDPITLKTGNFINEYSKRLHRWFRYVLPLPFEPKKGQLYHLFFTSNYETGIRVTKGFYTNFTGNNLQKLESRPIYKMFENIHGAESLFFGLKSAERPLEWKFLWDIIKNHEDGYCDIESPDLVKQERDEGKRREVLEWLVENDYLDLVNDLNLKWSIHPQIYQLNWSKLERAFGITKPSKLEPLHP